MTSVPVVSTQLNTRTVRECWDGDEWVEAFGLDLAWSALVREAPNRVRERLTADPAFVPLPEAPDLTCRECGDCGWMARPFPPQGEPIDKSPCELCGGRVPLSVPDGVLSWIELA